MYRRILHFVRCYWCQRQRGLTCGSLLPQGGNLRNGAMAEWVAVMINGAGKLRVVTISLLAAALTGCAFHDNRWDAGMPTMARHEVVYASGGNDEADVKAMLAIADRFNVRLTIVDAARGEPLHGTAVFLVGRSGGSALHVTEAGPMFYLQLPAGDYRLAIGYQDWLQLTDIVVDGQPLDLTFRLPADTPAENWLFCRLANGNHAAAAVL